MTVTARNRLKRPNLKTIPHGESLNISTVHQQDGVLTKAEPNAASGICEGDLHAFARDLRRCLESLPSSVLQKEETTRSVSKPERTGAVQGQNRAQSEVVEVSGAWATSASLLFSSRETR